MYTPLGASCCGKVVTLRQGGGGGRDSDEGLSVCDRLLVPAMCCGKVVTLRWGGGWGEGLRRGSVCLCTPLLVPAVCCGKVVTLSDGRGGGGRDSDVGLSVCVHPSWCQLCVVVRLLH